MLTVLKGHEITYRGSGGTALHILIFGGRWSESLASRAGRSVPRETGPCTHCIGGWVGSTAGLDPVQKTYQFILATSPLRLTTRIFIFELTTCGHNPYITFSSRRRWVCLLQLLLVLASVVIPRSASRGTHDHILLSQIRDSPQPEESSPRIYIPHEQDGPIIPPGTGFPFRRLLRLAGLRWRHSTPPPHVLIPTQIHRIIF
jgi:hypothetical protein